jgi:hypothetical protein
MNEKLKDLVAGLDLQTDLWWLALILTGFLASFLAAFAFPDAGAFWVYLAVFVRLGMTVCLSQQPWGAVFGRLLSLGLVTGLFSIFGDYLLVNWHDRGQRVYPDRAGALLLESPLYIPILWACSIVELGYAIVRIHGFLARHLGAEVAARSTMATGGGLAAIWTACTDFWAVKAGWWSYRPGEAILGGACALYVVVACFIVFFSFLPIFTRYLACPAGRVYASVRYGVILGGIIFASYVAAHGLVERRL